MIFDYSQQQTHRIHGPAGYLSYESYRPWLRDDFTFRCAYCLKRETWGHAVKEFELDHFRPQKLAPHRRLDYLNLVYACRRCNAVKLDATIDDPLTTLASQAIAVLPDGSIDSECQKAIRVIRQLDLDSPALRKWRVMWMRLVDLARTANPEVHERLIGLPDDLPDLSRLRPRSNNRSENVALCWYAIKLRGEISSGVAQRRATKP